MRNVILLTFYILIGNIFSTSLYADNSIKLHASHISINKGMHQSTIHAMYQDEFGMIWFGTKRGLVRYDGTQMKFIQKLYNDIPDAEELVRSITGDQNGNIYIETRSGIIEYNIKQDHFRKITPYSQCMYYSDSCLWIGYKNTIYQWKNNILKLHLQLPKESCIIDCITETSKGNLYIGTRDDGIFLIRRNKDTKQMLANINQIRQLYIDSEQKIWVATRRNGLFLIDSDENIKNYNYSENSNNCISSDIVRSICEDNSGNLWIATFNGLNKYDKKERKFLQYEFINENAYTLNDASIYCLMKDQQGTIWSGSFYGEINCFHPEHSTFSYHFVTKDIMPSSPSKHAIFGKTVEDNEGNLWMATERDGLYFFNTHTKALKKLPFTDNVQTLYLDKPKNILWIGTLLGGLKKYDLQTQSTQVFLRNVLHNNSIREIIPYNDSLIIATHNGISIFDTHTNKSTILSSEQIDLQRMSVTTILLDSQKQLWIAVQNQLLCYNLLNKSWQHICIRKSENCIVNKIIENRNGDILIGTSRHGIFRKRKGEAELEPFATDAILMKDIIDMCEDKYGGILIVTNEGLIYINNEEEITNIDKNRFLSTFQVNSNCLFLDRNNNVYLGGINMFCSFPLKQIFNKPEHYQVGISEFSVNDTPLEVDSSGKTLKQSILYTNRIELPYDQHAIGIIAYTNNYAASFTCGIKYKLEPFDKEWKRTNSLNEINYTNLSPDKYILYIQGDVALANGEFPERKLDIIINPPFYQTPLAYILYVLLTILLLYEAYQVIILRSSLKIEKEQKRNMEQLNQSKLRFFTNISHEFKTPLTLISNQVELLLQSKNIPPKLNTKLLNIWRNITRLNQLIIELMEFRKQEQGFTPLKVNYYNLIDIVNNVVDSFKEYAQTRKINLTLLAGQDDISFYFDKQLIEKALFNLLSNAFKFTPENGNIFVRLKYESMKVSLEISDTGVGINAKELENIFIRFYQTDNTCFTNNIGTGIGLAYTKNIVEAHKGVITVKSIKGKGSCFTIQLPTDIQYPPSNIQENLPIIEDYKLNVAGFISTDTQEGGATEERKENSEKHYKLLIIEDNQELRQLLTEVFSDLYNVETAENGKKGYEKALSVIPDIIISDVVMPEMSGTELCQKLKNNIKTSHIPIILLTSQTASEYIIEGLKIGADDYICKPFSIKQLIVRCNNLINLRRTLQQKYAKESNSSSELIATSTLDQVLLDKSIELIENNLENPVFSVDFLAQELCIGRTKYFTKIKAITGMTPNEFIINIKLKLAYRRIEQQPDISITELAMQLGFSSTSYFIKRFKEFSGMTPNQYKQKINENGTS